MELLLRSILASKVDQILVVLGHDAEIIDEIVKNVDTHIRTIVNPHYKQGGMSSSIRRGMEEALDSHAIMITPADIPLIPSEVFNQLIVHYFSKSPIVIIPTYEGRKGHPILIDSQLFEYVLNISEEKRGLKEIIELFKDEIVFLPGRVWPGGSFYPWLTAAKSPYESDIPKYPYIQTH